MLGCILLTISAVLSRSIEKYVLTEQNTQQSSPKTQTTLCSSALLFRVREDMDLPTNTLIGAHGYCTQV